MITAMAIVPIYHDSPEHIDRFLVSMQHVAARLADNNVLLRIGILADGSPHIPPDLVPLLRHASNQGLATTLLGGYQATLGMTPRPDIVVRVDCSQHDPFATIDLVTRLQDNPKACMVAAPIVWNDSNVGVDTVSVTATVAAVRAALAPIDSTLLQQLYFASIELAHQAFRYSALDRLTPSLLAARDLYYRLNGKPMKWGLDLLALLLAASIFEDGLEVVVPPTRPPWCAQRPGDRSHIPSRTLDVLALAHALGLSFRN